MTDAAPQAQQAHHAAIVNVLKAALSPLEDAEARPCASCFPKKVVPVWGGEGVWHRRCRKIIWSKIS